MKYIKDKRDRITVRLPDGYVLKISNKAKKMKISFSEIVRLAITKLLAGF
jgi:predicted DNA binding CopG/RHH family protein